MREKDVEALNRLTESVEALTTLSKKIGSVAQHIKSIAGKTRMLATNAMIEAHRSGAAGKGFAIVANQVGELSETTDDAVASIADAANELTNRLSQTQKNVCEISSTLGSSQASDGHGANPIHDASANLEKALDVSEETDSLIRAQVAMADEISKLLKQVQRESAA